MPEPRRVQMVSRDPQHCPDRPCMFHGAVPPGAAYIGRGMPGLEASPLANPFRGPHAAERYRVKLLYSPGLLELADEYVGERDVVCWCGPADDCHGDAVLQVLAGYREPHDLEPEDLA